MENPFLDTTFPPNWSEMKPSFAIDAINVAIELSKANIEKIKSVDDTLLSYENTIGALDNATEPLDRANTRLSHLASVADSLEIRKAVIETIGKVSEFYSSITLDSELYSKILAYSKTDSAKALQGGHARLLSETLLSFEQNGAKLGKEDKARLSQINSLLALKTQMFSENVLDSTKAFSLNLTNPDDVKGLPQSALDMASKCATQRGESGWTFTLDQPSYVPFIQYADSAEHRQTMWRASASVATEGEYSNWTLMSDILKLRQEKSQILGYANFADFILSRRMAGSCANALKFVEDLHSKYYQAFQKETSALLYFASENKLLSGEKIEPWSAAYFAEKLRKQKYDFDSESMRPYFPMERVMQGMFDIAERIYGIKVQRSSQPANAWHDSVELYEMYNENGRLMGLFYADFAPRKSKRAGAWMNLLEQARNGQVALGLIAGNLSEASDGKPALLSHDEVETLFHEFGHLIHFFMMDSEEIGLRDVVWDFVELPSQIMENWCRSREGLDMFAAHWQTGEKIPEDIFSGFEKSRKFRGASFAMRQLSFAQIDLLLHTNVAHFTSGDMENKARKALRDFVCEYSEPQPTILPRFTHLFGDAVGYASGYYSYKWAEVLAADAFSRFKREGIFNRELGREFANKILRVGNTIDASSAFENFMGRAPDATALVEESIEDSLK